jgi:hypothetical protein
MVRKLLTGARETSYWILSSLLTAECSTIELPGNRITPLFSFYYRKQIRAMTFGCVTRVLTAVYRPRFVLIRPLHNLNPEDTWGQEL